MTPHIVALDHFAGTGWGVACHWLGIREYGVEIMKEAIRTRRAVGFRTIYRDVWSGLLFPWLVPFHDLYIASPPCQTFSVAGRGSGRKALDQVLALIDSGAWKDPEKLRAAGADLGDDRTALVLSPLAHIWAHRPRLVALEQVPTVLPVWEAIADVLRGLGYSVWTGNLQAEQYGVPQTRKRAILMARLDGPVAPPVPTHSRYYSRDPQRLDPGVLKWVSMAEALGWGMTARPYPTIATGTEGGGTDPAALGGSGARKNVYAERASGRWAASGDPDNDRDGGVLRLQPGDASALQTFPAWGHAAGYASTATAGTRPRPVGEPSATVTGSGTFAFEREDGSRRSASPDELATLQSFPGWGFTDRPAMTLHGHGLLTRGPSGQKQAIMEGLERGTFIPRPPYTIDTARKGGEQRDDYVSLSDRYETDAVNFTVEEAAVLQSYPAVSRVFTGQNSRIGGGNTVRYSKSVDAPAPTVTGQAKSWLTDDGQGLSAEEVATLQTFPTVARKIMGAGMVERYGDRPGREIDQPAFTIRASAGGREPGGFVFEMSDGGTRKLEVSEAMAFQTFPAPFPFQGGRGKQFLQIGNAVPPLLAHAILSALIADPVAAEAASLAAAIDDEWADFGLMEPAYA